MEETELRRLRLKKRVAAKSAAVQQEFSQGDPELDELYLQAVECAEEMQWTIPNRFEFEENYRNEIEQINGPQTYGDADEKSER